MGKAYSVIDPRKLEYGDPFDLQKLLLDFYDEIIELKARITELEKQKTTDVGS